MLGSNAANGGAASGPVFDPETGALVRGSLPVPDDRRGNSKGEEVAVEGNLNPGTSTNVEKKKKKSASARIWEMMAASRTGPDTDDWVQYN